MKATPETIKKRTFLQWIKYYKRKQYLEITNLYRIYSLFGIGDYSSIEGFDQNVTIRAKNKTEAVTKFFKRQRKIDNIKNRCIYKAKQIKEK